MYALPPLPRTFSTDGEGVAVHAVFNPPPAFAPPVHEVIGFYPRHLIYPAHGVAAVTCIRGRCYIKGAVWCDYSFLCCSNSSSGESVIWRFFKRWCIYSLVVSHCRMSFGMFWRKTICCDDERQMASWSSNVLLRVVIAL